MLESGLKTPIANLSIFVSASPARAVGPDPHSFSLLDMDPDTGEKIFQIKTEKIKGNW